jgi:glycerophosphoryl diester phosphodiesterase
VGDELLGLKTSEFNAFNMLLQRPKSIYICNQRIYMKGNKCMANTLITAHSGCEATTRDSLDSVRLGIELGADCVEVDVRRDRYGSLVISHDKREYYSGAVMLETVMRCVADSMLSINCDLKEPSVLHSVLELAEICGVPSERLILSGSVSPDMLAADINVSKRARVYLNVEEILKYLLSGEEVDFRSLMTSPWNFIKYRYDALLDTRTEDIARIAIQLGAEAINLPFRNMTAERFDAFRKSGIPVSVWTVTDSADICRMLDEQPRNITTLQVKTALSLREQKVLP